MNRVFEPGEPILDRQWSFAWPRDFRKIMFYSFAFAAMGFLVLGLYRLSRFHDVPLLQNLLVGPVFDLCIAALSGIAASTIWRGHHSARGWAIAASIPFLLIFIRPFLIPMHPAPDHNLIALSLGLVGIAAFVWPG